MDERIEIVLAADDNFAMPLAVAARSVLESASKSTLFRFHIMDGGISARNKKKICGSISDARATINWIDTHLIKEKLLSVEVPVREPFSLVTYYRFMLAEVLPQNVCKAIYLDSDIIVRTDLSHLWQTDLSNYLLAAVNDPTIHSLSMARHLNEIDLARENTNRPYFNAGVLVVNIQKWRATKVLKKLLEIAKEYRAHLLFQDQDVMNLATCGSWLELDPVWNQTPYFFNPEDLSRLPYTSTQVESAIDSPNIVHYAANPKPWMKNCTHPYQNEYFTILDRTPWHGWRPNIYGRILRKLNLD